MDTSVQEPMNQENNILLKGTIGSGISEYKGVYFVAYRPHPGEVVIRDVNLSQIVHRSLIFANSDVDSKKT